MNGAPGCTNGTALYYVQQNEPNVDTPITCDHVILNTVQGRVSVTATHNVETWFASLIGGGDYTVSSTTTAVYGPPAAVTGLRPIGLCIDSHPGLLAAINNPTDSTGD